MTIPRSRELFEAPTHGDFVGAKLELARTFRGITQTALANDVCVSNALISYYENGKQTDPGPDLVEAWGEVLGFETDFFFTPIQDPFRDEECSFRHRRTAPETLKRRATAFGTLIGDVVGYLKTKLELPAYDVPSVRATSIKSVEDAAQACRDRWGLGSDTPVTHMGRVLENAGIAVVKTLASTEKVDAFSRRGATPIVILNTFKESTSHWIFDMAHELGHFMCHADKQTGSIETEREADAFASAFLLPARPFAREFTSAPFSWDHIFELKARWQVSAAAIVYRVYSLGLIDAITYRRAFQYMSARGWRKNEPGEPPPQEPELIRESLTSLYRDLGEDPLALCQRLHFKPATFEELTGIAIHRPVKGKEVINFQRVKPTA